MPRGKPFVCWLDYQGRRNDVALHIGDECEYHDLSTDKWVRAKIGTQRDSGLYVARFGKRVEHVFMRCSLRPITGKD